MVNHYILLQKLALYRLSENAIKLFKSYLIDRCQMLQFQYAMSESMSITSRVHQGSILGPLFFIMVMNDLPLEIENWNLRMSADNSTLEANCENCRRIRAEYGFGHDLD